MIPERRCPRCSGSPLNACAAEPDLLVDICSACQGIWCDRGELEGLLHSGLVLPLPFANGGADGPPCPACDEPLASRTAPLEEPVELLDCLHCGGVWLDGGALQRLRAEARRRMPREAAPRHRRQNPATAPEPFNQRIPFNLPLVNWAALPVAFLLALIMNLTGIKVLLYPFQILVHELGHASTAWLSGRLAVPLPMGVTFWSGRVGVVSLAVLAGLLALGYFGWRERWVFFLGSVATLLLLHLYLGWGASEEASQMWAIFGGIAGELLIGAFFVVAFYYRAPKKLRWDFWRYVALLPGACALTVQILLWRSVADDPSRMPLGSALAGTRDGSGDLEKLINLYGWSEGEILAAYQGIGNVCILVVVAHYAYFALAAFIRTSRGGRSPRTATASTPGA